MKPEKSDGGPSSYYDFEPGWTTFNDFMEHKALHQWGGYALHLKDIGKALCRFGAKEGTTRGYDARKIIYSGLRLLMMIEGKGAVVAELQRLAADKQFQLDPVTPQVTSEVTPKVVPAEPVFKARGFASGTLCLCGMSSPCKDANCAHPFRSVK